MKIVVDGEEIEIDKIMNEEELALDTMDGFVFPEMESDLEKTKKIELPDLEDTLKLPIVDLEDTKDYGDLFHE